MECQAVWGAGGGEEKFVCMFNYTIQYRYDRKEDSIPYPSSIELKVSDHPEVVNTKVRPFLKAYLEEKQVWKGHEYLEELRVYGKDGELIFDLHELDEKGE